MLLGLLALIAILVAAMPVLGAPQACPPPGSPSSFWGYVTLNGAAAPAGLKLAAWVGGAEAAVTTTQDAGGDTYYLLDAPERAYDSETGQVCRAGGAAGETVTFVLCDALTAGQTGTWHGGTMTRLDLALSGSCQAGSPAPPNVVISRTGEGVTLRWGHVAADTRGQALEVVRYDVWRSAAPYFVPSGNPYAAVQPPPAAQAGDPVIYADASLPASGSGRFYVVRAVSATGQASADSNRVGVFVFQLVPGQP
jgi:hypothetical protein